MTTLTPAPAGTSVTVRVRRGINRTVDATVSTVVAHAGVALRLSFDFPYDDSRDMRLTIPAHAPHAERDALLRELARLGAIDAADAPATGQAALW